MEAENKNQKEQNKKVSENKKTPHKAKYLEWVKNSIVRMEKYSVRAKELSVLMVAVSWCVLDSKEYELHIFFGMFILVCMFWYQSSSYRYNKQVYHNIYDEVATKKEITNRDFFRLTPEDEDYRKAGFVISVMFCSGECLFFTLLQIANAFFAFSWDDLGKLFRLGESCCCPFC